MCFSLAMTGLSQKRSEISIVLRFDGLQLVYPKKSNTKINNSLNYSRLYYVADLCQMLKQVGGSNGRWS